MATCAEHGHPAGKAGADVVQGQHLDAVRLPAGEVGQRAAGAGAGAPRHLPERAHGRHGVGQRPLAGAPGHCSLLGGAVHHDVHPAGEAGYCRERHRERGSEWRLDLLVRHCSWT